MPRLKESNPVPSPVAGLKALEMKGFLAGSGAERVALQKANVGLRII
jgi:hypothetical protein